MRLILIPDKFKGSLTAAGVCQAIEGGVRQVYPDAEIAVFPASDGGDGFLEAVRSTRVVEEHRVPVEDPLGRQVVAPFLLDRSTGAAFVEMASASGMLLLKASERNPMKTHTRGTGQLIQHALEAGAGEVYVGLGGSATNDGGCGIATAFGYRFLDASGEELPPTGEHLSRMAEIRMPPDKRLLDGARLYAVNDVTNPLWGPEGAAPVYAGQKGASPEDIDLLDAGLQHLDRIVADQLGRDASRKAGAGAAGGAAYGMHCFLNARLIGGAEYVLSINGLSRYLSENPVDYIVTGEGRMDAQTLHGKFIKGVLELAGPYGIPVLAVCGAADISPEALKAVSSLTVLKVSDPSKPLAYNMENADRLTREAVKGFFESLAGG